jgi:circadian clock protein KaiC
MVDVKELGRLSSGVPGLDVVLAGGFFETGVYIVEGPPGAGKTMLANQICFHQAAQRRRAVYYTLLTESHDRMLGFLKGLAFFDASVIPRFLTYVSGFRVLEAEGLAGVVRSVRDILTAEPTAVLAIDGLVSAEEIAPSNTAFKKFLHEIQAVASVFRCTVILLTNTDATTRRQAEETMVDGIIELDASVVRLKPQRSLTVRKFRGAGQVRGAHTLNLSERGVIVRPRIETVLPSNNGREHAGASPLRRPFHIESLDAMIGGGIPSESNAMVMGPSGTGKTILGLQFLAGGLAAGENVLLFTFYEQIPELIAKAARLGIDLSAAHRSGQLQAVRHSSVEASVDEIGNSLLAAFAKYHPTRLFIDSMQGFQVTADPEERIQDFFAAISEYFIGAGATMMFSAETNDLLGAHGIRVPFPNASRMCQNIFLLRHSEINGKVRKVFSVFKMRDSDFDPTVRELIIGHGGIHIGAPIEGTDKILSGQPLRVPTVDGGRRDP